jgi:hypothetical protein
MKQPNVYEQSQFLYGYPELDGKPATAYYLPTPKSRKWRKAFSVRAFSKSTYDTALQLVHGGDWYSFKFEEGML